MGIFSKPAAPVIQPPDETAKIVVKVYTHFVTVTAHLMKTAQPDMVERGVVLKYESDALRLALLGYAPVATSWLPTWEGNGFTLRASLTVTYVKQTA